MLGLGNLLIVSGPLRAAWRRLDDRPLAAWAEQLPMLLSLTAVYSVLTFFTQDMH
jgi:hypothetical protein